MKRVFGLLVLLLCLPAHSAVTRAAGNAFLEAEVGGSASVNRAFVNNVTAGSLLVAIQFRSINETQTCADNNGNTWQAAHTSPLHAGLVNAIDVWYAMNSNAGATTVTCSSASSGVSRHLVIVEYIGVATTSAEDGTSVDNQASTSANPDPGAITTTTDGVLIGALINGASATPTAGTNYTRQFATGTTDSLYPHAVEDWITPSAQVANHPNWTLADGYWLAVGVALKAAAGGGGSALPLIRRRHH